MRACRVRVAGFVAFSSALLVSSWVAAFEPPIEVASAQLEIAVTGRGELTTTVAGATRRSEFLWDGSAVGLRLQLEPATDMLEARLLLPETVVARAGGDLGAGGSAGLGTVSMLELRFAVGELPHPASESKQEAAARERATPTLGVTGLRLVVGGQVRDLRDLALATGRTVSLVEFAPGLGAGFELNAVLETSGDRAPIELEVRLLTGSRVVVDKEGPIDACTVRSLDGGILCGPGCKRAVTFVAPGTGLELVAETDPQAVAAFVGWSGGCTPLADDRVILAAPDHPDTVSCTAAFIGDEPTAEEVNGRDGTWSNPQTITISDLSAASPYPSSILVEQAGGSIVDVDVVLTGVNHTYPDDMDVLLVPTAGDSIVLMSDACGEHDLNTSVTFDADAPGPMPDFNPCNSGPYLPTDYEPGDVWPAPAPVSGHTGSLSTLYQQNPNGVWSLFIVDDAGSDVGSISGGWSINLVIDPAAIVIPAVGTSGPAAPYPAVFRREQPVGPISYVEVFVEHAAHTFPDDMDMLLVSPGGTGVVLMSDACGSEDVTEVTWWFHDNASAAMPDEGPCGDLVAQYRPTNFGGGDSWPAPAPPGPYAADFSAFDGENPYGDWKLFVIDDTGGDSGYLRTEWSVDVLFSGTAVDIPGSGSVGPGDPYPLTQSVPVLGGTITGVAVEIVDLHHSFADDVGLLLQSPAGTAVLLMANACGGRVEGLDLILTDGGPAIPDNGPCPSATYRPTGYGSVNFPAPAPAGPYSTTLSAFIGELPNGDWKLWAVDDANGDAGFITQPFVLALSLQLPTIFADGFESGGTSHWSSTLP